LTSKEFKKLKLQERWEFLKDSDALLGYRFYGGFRIELYSPGDFYTEVWKKAGLNQIYWIEITSIEQVEKNYAQLFPEIKL